MHLRAREDELEWKAFKHLLPFFLVFGLLVYLGAAYVGEMQRLEKWEFLERADERLRAQSTGHQIPPLTRDLEPEEAVAVLQSRFGVEGNDLPTFDDDADGLAVTLCEEWLPSGACYGLETRFAVAYAVHVERMGLDTWNVVMAPERHGRFTRDPVRIVYVLRTAGSKVAFVTAGPLFEQLSWEGDSTVAQLNSFDDSELGERIGELANEGDIERLNRIGLSRSEWRFEEVSGTADLPFEAEIYALVNDEGRSAARWLGGEGEVERALTRIVLIGGALGLLWGFGRFLFRSLAYTAAGIPPLIASVRKRLKE